MISLLSIVTKCHSEMTYFGKGGCNGVYKLFLVIVGLLWKTMVYVAGNVDMRVT